MLKVRLTFEDIKDGSNIEIERFLKFIESEYVILNQSKVYKGRGNSKYSNLYLDIK